MIVAGVGSTWQIARIPSRPQVASRLRSLGANWTRVTTCRGAHSASGSFQQDWNLPEPLWWSKMWWTPENAYVSSRDLPIANALSKRKKNDRFVGEKIQVISVSDLLAMDTLDRDEVGNGAELLSGMSSISSWWGTTVFFRVQSTKESAL